MLRGYKAVRPKEAWCWAVSHHVHDHLPGLEDKQAWTNGYIYIYFFFCCRDMLSVFDIHMWCVRLQIPPASIRTWRTSVANDDGACRRWVTTIMAASWPSAVDTTRSISSTRVWGIRWEVSDPIACRLATRMTASATASPAALFMDWNTLDSIVISLWLWLGDTSTLTTRRLLRNFHRRENEQASMFGILIIRNSYDVFPWTSVIGTLPFIPINRLSLLLLIRKVFSSGAPFDVYATLFFFFIVYYGCLSMTIDTLERAVNI